MLVSRLKDSLLTAAIAAILALPLAGARTIDGAQGLTVEWHLIDVAVAAVMIFLGRLSLGLVSDGKGSLIAPLALGFGVASCFISFPSSFLKIVAIGGAVVVCVWAIIRRLRRGGESKPLWQISSNLTAVSKKFQNLTFISLTLIAVAVILPLMPFSSRYLLDVMIMVMTYIMLAWGLNITVGYTGLLDLGYAGFYALGAYSFALLALHTGIGFWLALPIAAAITAATAFILGLPVLRLRGDYFAIVTLGFGEIVRLVLINWTSLTGGPNGMSGVPRPVLFNLDFARQAGEGRQAFHEFFGLEFNPVQRVIFLYYIILILALFVGWLSSRLRRLPLGRAWEAFREDEIACASLGINRWGIKIAAYCLGAAVAGMAGAFFATRQGFVSPESFTFTESATMLAIVILGGIGHPLGIVFAALFIIGLPELFRELEQYRMLAFGSGMVLIMLWRPGGMMASREVTIKLQEKIPSPSRGGLGRGV